MSVSELIYKLSLLKAKHGPDLQVCLIVEDWDMDLAEFKGDKFEEPDPRFDEVLQKVVM